MKALVYTILFLLVPFSVLAEIKIESVKAATPGVCDGEIRGVASGSAGPFQITLNGVGVLYGVNGAFTLNHLCEGNYDIGVVNTASCTVTLKARVPSKSACSTLDVVLEQGAALVCTGASA